VTGDAIAGAGKIFTLGHEGLVVGARFRGQTGEKRAGKKD
jgi:hypothetical protein